MSSISSGKATMGDSHPPTPTATSPLPSPGPTVAIEEAEHEPDIPLTMTASVVLTQLPIDTTAALQEAGAFPKPKGLYPHITSSSTLNHRGRFLSLITTWS